MQGAERASGNRTGLCPEISGGSGHISSELFATCLPACLHERMHACMRAGRARSLAHVHARVVALAPTLLAVEQVIDLVALLRLGRRVDVRLVVLAAAAGRLHTCMPCQPCHTCGWLVSATRAGHACQPEDSRPASVHAACMHDARGPPVMHRVTVTEWQQPARCSPSGAELWAHVREVPPLPPPMRTAPCKPRGRGPMQADASMRMRTCHQACRPQRTHPRRR